MTLSPSGSGQRRHRAFFCWPQTWRMGSTSLLGVNHHDEAAQTTEFLRIAELYQTRKMKGKQILAKVAARQVGGGHRGNHLALRAEHAQRIRGGRRVFQRPLVHPRPLPPSASFRDRPRFRFWPGGGAAAFGLGGRPRGVVGRLT